MTPIPTPGPTFPLRAPPRPHQFTSGAHLLQRSSLFHQRRALLRHGIQSSFLEVGDGRGKRLLLIGGEGRDEI
ncbi:hypothetical protein KSP40_PGU001334 [Platanthera guangdongensis]|uniref:Uncharacterized protein n=1 Tax=Platanthera guangdongensis TaxID=2320717 RepID=A0ABR2MVT1_9ASPA